MNFANYAVGAFMALVPMQAGNISTDIYDKMRNCEVVRSNTVNGTLTDISSAPYTKSVQLETKENMIKAMLNQKEVWVIYRKRIGAVVEHTLLDNDFDGSVDGQRHIFIDHEGKPKGGEYVTTDADLDSPYKFYLTQVLDALKEGCRK